MRGFLEEVRRRSSSVLYGTVTADGEITLDKDGYPIFADEADYYTMPNITYSIGDRIVAIPLGDSVRSKILVLGRFMGNVAIVEKRYNPIYVVGNSPITTPIDAGGPSSASVSSVVQISGGWYHSNTEIRIVGFTSKTGGAALTVTVTDSTNGVLKSVNTVGEFEIILSRSQIGDDDFNTLTVAIAYADAQNGSASLSKCVALVSDQ